MGLIDFHNVAACCEFHDHAESLWNFVVKSILVADDVFVVVRGEDSDLVEGILFFFGLHRCNFYLLQMMSTFFKAYYLPSNLRLTL